MLNIKKLLSFSLLFFVTACSTIPTEQKIKTDLAKFELPKLPDNGKAIVYIVRPNHLMNGPLQKFDVFLDSQTPESKIGHTTGNQYIYFDVTPGEHVIFSKADNLFKEKINVKAGDVIFLRQYSFLGGLFKLKVDNVLIKIDEVEGRYYVKNLSLGTIKKPNK